MGEDEGEEEDTPRRPDDTNSDDKGEEHGNQLPLLHGCCQAVTCCDERQVKSCWLRLFSESRGGEPVLSPLQVIALQQEGLLKVMSLPI